MIRQDIRPIQMTDLRSQSLRLKSEIDAAIEKVIAESAFINGPEVSLFAGKLAAFNGVKHVIPCANGTEAIQIALMALNLAPGSEVISPGFCYAAVAEVCKLLNLKPVFADVDQDTFNLNPSELEKHINKNTKVIIPVHLFGQSADMETILAIAEKHGLYVIEDNAQSIGAEYSYSDGNIFKTGAMGHMAICSFFPTKNLACFGDGGAVLTNDDSLAAQMKMIANHGQKIKYQHEVLGINSRLDTIQAAILNVKLNHLNDFIAERRKVAAFYDQAFENNEAIRIPKRSKNSTHVFHQYTLQIFGIEISVLREKLKDSGIPTMVYYPYPVYRQKAFFSDIYLPVSEALSNSVMSLPMGTDMDETQTEYISRTILEIINKK